MSNYENCNCCKRAPFRLDHVGSFLRPERLKEARAKFSVGEITAEELERVENEEIIALVEKEKRAWSSIHYRWRIPSCFLALRFLRKLRWSGTSRSRTFLSPIQR